ncbi:hypothetical protein KY289_001124 [Solanum tuberosum]|nr:hypothetical protein KY289_001124 [Solanum tuberosum]
MFHTNGFGSITMGSNARDLVALTNEVRSVQDYGILFYQIGRAVTQNVLLSPMNWDFPIGPGHFGASGSFMMKRMSFKRMIRGSCRVEPCSTRHEIDLKPFFE